MFTFLGLGRRKNKDHNLISPAPARVDANTVRPKRIFSRIFKLKHLSWLGPSISPSPNPTPAVPIVTEDSDASSDSDDDTIRCVSPEHDCPKSEHASTTTASSTGPHCKPSTIPSPEKPDPPQPQPKPKPAKQTTSIPGTENDIITNSGSAHYYTPLPNNGRGLTAGVDGRIKISADQHGSIKVFNSGNDYTSTTVMGVDGSGRTGRRGTGTRMYSTRCGTGTGTGTGPDTRSNTGSAEAEAGAQIDAHISEFVQRMLANMGPIPIPSSIPIPSPPNPPRPGPRPRGTTIFINGMNNTTQTEYRYPSGTQTRTQIRTGYSSHTDGESAHF